MSTSSPSALDGNPKVLSATLAERPRPSRKLGRNRFEQLQRLERLEPFLRANVHDTASNSWISPWCLSPLRRFLDIISATVLLLLCSPVLIVAALAIMVTSPGPVFYRQWRTGFAGQRFKMYKLRTMVRNADQLKDKVRALNHHSQNGPDFKCRNDPRVTAVGRILRKSSLDELPNLINVIRGEMSLVGPRPTSFDIDAYQDQHLARLAVPPGITGLWQISGRSEVDFDDRVKLDCRYIQEQSFLTDMRILLVTPFCVLGGRGAY
ncbi:MAG TPA: sugar transferase [Candidatus Limnocylindria bacterium]|nr:sugar transferase [Candidatus Limnocylindria bacterium]